MASCTCSVLSAKPALPKARGTAGRRVNVVAASSHAPAQQDGTLQRRQLLSLSLLAPAAAALLGSGAVGTFPALAEEVAAAPAPGAPAAASSTRYTDPVDAFSIEVPAGWVQGSGTIGDAGTLTSQQARFSNAAGLRKVVAFLPEGKPEVSVAVTVQFLGADYTGLGSFGTAQDFATGVVSKMDTSYIARLPEWRRVKEGPVQVVKLVDVKDKNKQQYVFSYTIDKADEPLRTVWQAVAIGNNGMHNRFYTVNATCTAADCAQYGPVLQKIVNSFAPPTL
ncbi:hypothetical protein D9Q98_001395 [Chlorella vulgaris]|uniref:PsbP C-terminal domain-containing protein n=1 Tax=Chlorella vulgaris TaxID=3077 RepID=A0A9D4TZU5_CHLVU|nr:hypothetical protein D9Q98_001395 [Chlorella vulgaris]